MGVCRAASGDLERRGSSRRSPADASPTPPLIDRRLVGVAKSYLGDSVRLGAVGDLGGSRAVGGVHVNDLGDDRGVALVVGRGASSGGEDDGSGELHLVGIKRLLGE